MIWQAWFIISFAVIIFLFWIASLFIRKRELAEGKDPSTMWGIRKEKRRFTPIEEQWRHSKKLSEHKGQGRIN